MVAAATVNHQLRAEAAEEAEAVAEICERLGVPHITLPVQVPDGNVQSMARQARYSALAQWMTDSDLTLLATAHHADDQAETLLMRLNRGSGLAGLAAVREESPIPGAPDATDTNYRLIRPLLAWRKSELQHIVRDAGLEPALDPSNNDDAYDRVRLRKALAEADWLDPVALAASASHLADAHQALDWAAEREWNAQVEQRGESLVYRPDAPRAIKLMIVARIIAALGKPPRGGAVAQLVTTLENGQGGNVGGVLGSIARENSDADGTSIAWIFQPEPPRNS